MKLRSSNNQRSKPSYKEPNALPTPYQPRIRTKSVSRPPFSTIFAIARKQGMKISFEDEQSFMPLKIYEFIVMGDEKLIRMDIWTIEGDGKSALIRKKTR